MKYLLSLLLVGFLACPAAAQHAARYAGYAIAPIGFTPSKLSYIYGININIFSSTFQKKKSDLPRVYGLELDIDPTVAFTAPTVTLVYLFKWDSWEAEVSPCDGLVYGTYIGAVGKRDVTGLSLSAFINTGNLTKGVALAGLINHQGTVKGLALAGIANQHRGCQGLQIALINKCNNLRGFQIGLWNMNQRRTLPFINWAFRR